MGYRKSLERVTEAKVKFVTKTLNALYADNEEQKTLDDIAANILKYENNMKECDKALVADYTLKLGQAISEMESNYKCEYKCTFNTGCYSFNCSSYNRKCVTFPTPKKVSYKLVGVAPFKATWKGACQPEKKDCKAQTVDVYVAEPRVTSCVYSSRLDVPKEWFTAKFYLDDGHIENVPKEGENQCDQEIAADILDGSKFTKALDKRRGQLVDLLNAQWGKDETEGFCKIIHDEHQKVLGEYEQALSDAGREGVITESSEYKAFKSKLDSRKTMAKSQFDCSVTSATSRLQCYHQRIVSRIVQCLSMRKCRIA